MSGSGPAIGTREWYDHINAEHLAAKKALARDHVAKGEPIPDLDLMPDCSICGGTVDYDDHFYCDTCCVHWRRDGTDGERDVETWAEVYPDDAVRP